MWDRTRIRRDLHLLMGQISQHLQHHQPTLRIDKNHTHHNIATITIARDEQYQRSRRTETPMQSRLPGSEVHPQLRAPHKRQHGCSFRPFRVRAFTRRCPGAQKKSAFLKVRVSSLLRPLNRETSIHSATKLGASWIFHWRIDRLGLPLGRCR